MEHGSFWIVYSAEGPRLLVRRFGRKEDAVRAFSRMERAQPVLVPSRWRQGVREVFPLEEGYSFSKDVLWRGLMKVPEDWFDSIFLGRHG